MKMRFHFVSTAAPRRALALQRRTRRTSDEHGIRIAVRVPCAVAWSAPA